MKYIIYLLDKNNDIEKNIIEQIKDIDLLKKNNIIIKNYYKDKYFRRIENIDELDKFIKYNRYQENEYNQNENKERNKINMKKIVNEINIINIANENEKRRIIVILNDKIDKINKKFLNIGEQMMILINSDKNEGRLYLQAKSEQNNCANKNKYEYNNCNNMIEYRSNNIKMVIKSNLLFENEERECNKMKEKDSIMKGIITNSKKLYYDELNPYTIYTNIKNIDKNRKNILMKTYKQTENENKRINKITITRERNIDAMIDELYDMIIIKLYENKRNKLMKNGDNNTLIKIIDISLKANDIIRNKVTNKKIKEMKIKNIKKIDRVRNEYNKNQVEKIKEINEESYYYFYSILCMTNWIEEMEENSCIGIIVNLEGSIMASKNIFTKVRKCKLLKKCASIDDYIEKKITDNETKKKAFVNYREIGEGNMIIPLYINKYHWKIAREYLPLILGCNFSADPFKYNKRQIDNIFKILSLASDELIHNINDNSIIMYIQYYRTCYEIIKEMGYHKGFEKIIKKYETDDNRNEKMINILNIIGQQIILKKNIDENKNYQILYYFIDDIIHFNIKAIYDVKSNFKEWKRNNETKEYLKICIHEELEMFVSYIYESLKRYYSIKTVTKILKDVETYNGGIKKFIKKIDDNTGLIDNENLNYIKKLLKNTNINDIFNNEIFKVHISKEYEKTFIIQTEKKYNENFTNLIKIHFINLLENNKFYFFCNTIKENKIKQVTEEDVEMRIIKYLNNI